MYINLHTNESHCIYLFLLILLFHVNYNTDPNLKVNHQETIVSDKVIKFYHKENDLSKMIRAYIDAVKRLNYSLFERELLLLYISYTKSHKLLSFIISIFKL